MSVLKQNSYPSDKAGLLAEQETSQNRFLALVRESADVFWLLTPEGRMVEQSSSWQIFTGQQVGDSSGQGWREMVHARDLPGIDEVLARAVSTRCTGEVACRLVGQNGMYRSLYLRIIPVSGTDDSIAELLVCGKGTARRKLAQCMSEAQVELALKAARVGMWDWDIVEDRLTWTEQCKALFGWSADTPVTRKSFLAALHPDDRELVDRASSRALSEKVEYSVEYRAVWQNGSIRWFMNRARGIYNARGKAVRLVGATIDITDLKQAEERVREGEMRTRNILESITDMFAGIDRNDRYIYVNRRLEEYVGKKREEMLGQSIWDVFPFLRGTDFEHACHEAMETQKMVRKEIYFPTLQTWNDICFYPTSSGLSIYGQEITERKRIADALRETETRFRHFVDSDIIGIIVAGMDGTIYEANDVFLNLVGYTREDLEAKRLNWESMTPPEYKPHEMRAFEEESQTGSFQPFEKEYITKDGKRVPVLVGGTLLHQNDAIGLMISFVLDMSAQKAMERQKDLFLGMTSHELKTPLAALKGTLQLVEKRLKRVQASNDALSPDMGCFIQDLAKHLATSLRQVDLQTHLINDLLDVSRITANALELSLQERSLEAIVREAVEDVRIAVPDRQIHIDLPEEISVAVLVDAERISQVITNYITNAIRYSPAEKSIFIGLERRGEVARVWVKDEGPGLSEEARRDIWQRFHRAKGIVAQNGSGKGLGLGLYICQMLVAHHRGEVGVDSIEGQGCTFWFTLPLVKEDLSLVR